MHYYCSEIVKAYSVFGCKSVVDCRMRELQMTNIQKLMINIGILSLTNFKSWQL